MTAIVRNHIDLPRLDRFADGLMQTLFLGDPFRVSAGPDDPASSCAIPRVIGLVGTLGAGKTRLTQAIASALGIDVAAVTSPTFTLVQTHRGHLHTEADETLVIELHHVDAYRIADEDEWFEAGMEELLEPVAPSTSAGPRLAAPASLPLVVIEWADRFESLMPPQTLWVHLDWDPDDSVARDASSDPSARRRLTILGSPLRNEFVRDRLAAPEDPE